MARLHRFVKLNDRLDTQIFTFLLPPTLINDAPKDMESKEFVYGNQKWNIYIVKNDRHVGVYLVLKGQLAEGVVCKVDFSFTFNNKEHFTKNDSFSERNWAFTHSRPKFGRKNYITMDELLNRNYAMDNGQFLLALEMRNPVNYFEQMIQLPNENSKSTQIGGANRYQKIETNYFPCGNFMWNVAVYPFGDVPDKDGIPMIYLVRQNNFDHHCRVRYRIILGHGDKSLDTDVMEQVFDTSGAGKAYEIRSNFRYNLYALASGKKLNLRIELIGATAISECNLFPKNRQRNKTSLYDREKQAWMIESDTSLDRLKFRLFYSDVHNVAQRHIRYMGFGISVVPRRGHYKPIPAVEVPYFQLYTQRESDVEGYDIQTDITVKEINNPASAILDEEGRLTVHVEWIDSVMLFNDQYNKIDEIDSRHKHQMAREIMALQAENLSLEKQLHSYQLSIAKNTSSKEGLEVPSTEPLPPVITKNCSIKDVARRSSSPRTVRCSTPDSRKSAKRDRSKDKRRLPAASEAALQQPGPDERFHEQYANGGGNNYATNNVYDYQDGWAGGEKRHDGYIDDIPAQRYGDDYAPQDAYHRDEYRDDYHYYSDKYSKSDCAGPTYDKYYNNKPYDDPYAAVDPYASKTSPEKYPDVTAHKYNDAYGTAPYSTDTRYNNLVDTYPEDISFNKDRYPRKTSEGRVGKSRDQQSDDGYYSSSTQHHLDANLMNAAHGLTAQYLEKLPDDRLNGRRSPSFRRKHGGRKTSTSSDVTKSPELGSHSPGVTRSKSRREKRA